MVFCLSLKQIIRERRRLYENGRDYTKRIIGELYFNHAHYMLVCFRKNQVLYVIIYIFFTQHFYILFNTII